jgi:hypothetical protein
VRAEGAAGTIMVAPERRAGFQSDSCRTASTAQVRELQSICVRWSQALERDKEGGMGCASTAPFRTPSIVTFRTID